MYSRALEHLYQRWLGQLVHWIVDLHLPLAFLPNQSDLNQNNADDTETPLRVTFKAEQDGGGKHAGHNCGQHEKKGGRVRQECGQY